MTYQEALILVKSEFETLRESSHNEIVLTGLTYDGSCGFCVSLYDQDGKAIITDLGETKEVFDEVEKKTWQALCEENGFRFNRWRIERDFNALDDLYAFIAFLDKISDRFYVIEDDD